MQNVNVLVLWLWDRERSELLAGGMERWCRDLCDLIVSHGYRVTIYQKATRSFEHKLTDSITVYGIKASLNFLGNWTLSRYVESHCDANEPFIFVSQELALSRKLKRSVGINHGIFWNGDLPWYKRAANKRLQRYLIERLRGVVCVDTNYINWCHAELRGRAKWRSKLHYIPNYADVSMFVKSNNAGNSPTSDDKFTILFARRMDGRSIETHGRGLGFLLDAVRLLEMRGIGIRVICAGRGSLKKDIPSWLARKGMHSEVIATEVELDKVFELYSRCDVVVVPSLEHEGTSLAAIEGLLSGRPVIVSHIGGLANIVIDGLNGQVCDLRPESLAECLLKVYQRGAPGDIGIVKQSRLALGKKRWEEDVWKVLEERLDLCSERLVGMPE